MTLIDFPHIVQFASFTIGCLIIHNFRRYPNQITFFLIVIIIALLLTLAVKITPDNVLVDESNAEIGASISSAIK